MTPTPAAAGAWIAPEDGQQIWTQAAGMRDQVSFFETSAYWEIPLASSVAVVAAPWVEQAYDVGDDGWRAEASVGLKWAVLREGDNVMALQGGVVWNSWPSFGCEEAGAEVRWLGGRSFGAGFVNIEAAEPSFGGDCGGERLDITAGYRASERWLTMGQVFVDAPREGAHTVKAQISLVRFGDEGRAIQIGLRGRLDEGLSEPALIIGFWGRPGD